jgi:signal transduction histidine kinase
MRLKLMPRLLVLFLLATIIPLVVLEAYTQVQLRSAVDAIKNAPLTVQSVARELENLVQGQSIGFWGTVIVALALTALAAITLRRSIVHPLYQLQANARKLLAGEFPTFELPGVEDEELVGLTEALREMSTGLHALVVEADLHSKDIEKLYQETKRRAVALETIHGVSQRISTILDIDDLLPEIVELIRSGFDYDRVHLFTADLVAGELVFRAGAGRAGRIGAEIGERVRIGLDTVVGEVASTNQPVVVKDFAREPRYRFSPTENLTKRSYIPLLETRSELVVPMQLGNRIIGVLSVQSDRTYAFDADDLFVLQEIASQAAGAIANAQLYEEAFNHAEEVMALLMTSVAVSSAPDLDVRLEAIAHQAKQLTNADGCTVYRLDEMSSMLYPLISLDPRSAEMMAARIALGEGIAGRVAQLGAGEILNYKKSELPDELLLDEFDPPECVTAVPLLVSDRVIGAMAVRRQSKREFVPHDLELLTMFASHAAVAIENAQLYEEIKERAENLQQAYQKLEEADRIKDEMIQNISHELRTPLTFVIGYLGLMLDGDLGPLTQQQRDSLALVLRRAQLLTRMVDDIITLQTIRIAQPDLKPVDIVPLAKRAIDVAGADAKKAALDITLEYYSDAILVNGAPARLAQVFDNLLNNAIKFSPNGGEISVRVLDAESEVRVEVQDTGIGIPPDKLDKVFDRFYQVDGTATRQFGGLGMGLAICKEIIKAHGGRMWAKSPTSGDHGTTLYFTLQKASDVLPEIG